ncbi:hypothetical protein NFHSH190041_01790 [Shewanella sp. NFH-SH190041]|uniref:flagellar FliJ family protein n=1 Tax=Shewanella sp. NFH-SH190041 TaxID=2950245 RepID=UPI0021C48E4A|nr:flagellar FliJ family protein [Shewanella sp. NFH-SH190041]BDM62727.1 hypothetical protein NFHSH190041_01790 [Shewanella sp. NFH-SH190041]
MNALIRLSEREEDKLKQLGSQRQQLANQIHGMEQQLQLLRQLNDGYLGSSYHNSLLWQNQQQLTGQLEPMDKALARQISLHQVELSRIEKLWRAQLGRLQGLKWLLQHKRDQARTLLARQEQKACDDLAGRRYAG